jgi:hypothetical protein
MVGSVKEPRMNETLRTIRALRKMGATYVSVGDVTAQFEPAPAAILPGAYEAETPEDENLLRMDLADAEARLDLTSLLGVADEWERMTDEEREAVQYHSAGG